MPELGPYGSVRGARGNSRPYRESRRWSGQTDANDPKRASRPYGTIIVKIMLCLKPAG